MDLKTLALDWLTGYDCVRSVKPATRFFSRVEPSVPAPSPSLSTDLVDRIASADPTPLAEVYDQCSATVHAVALRITRERNDGEEVTQDVFQSLWDHATTLQGREANVLAWLVVAARRRSIDLLRKRNRRPTAAQDIGEGESSLLDRISADDDDSGEQLVAHEQAEAVKAAMAELPEEQTHVVRLAFFGGFSHGEIAENLSLPLGTVKSRLRYALAKLRGKLGGLRQE